jgi:hypothetical protein
MIFSFSLSIFIGFILGLLYAHAARLQYELSMRVMQRSVFVVRFLGVGLRLGVLFGVSTCCVLWGGCSVEALGAGIAAGYMSFTLWQVYTWM